MRNVAVVGAGMTTFGEHFALGVEDDALHHFHGLHNQTGVRNLWGWTVLFASLGLFALGGSGIFMWFKLYEERTIGLVLLGANLVVSVALLIALRR